MLELPQLEQIDLWTRKAYNPFTSPDLTPLWTGWGQGRFKVTVWLLQCLVRPFTSTISLIPLQPSQIWLKMPRNMEKMHRTSAIPHTRNCVHIEPFQDIWVQRSGLFWSIAAKLVTSVCLRTILLLKGPPSSFITEASATFMSMLVILNFWHCGRYSQIPA